MDALICLILSIAVVISSIIIHCKKPVGTLRIDHTNPEKDIYRIEIDDFDLFDSKKKIVLKVDHNANFSQK